MAKGKSKKGGQGKPPVTPKAARSKKGSAGKAATKKKLVGKKKPIGKKKVVLVKPVTPPVLRRPVKSRPSVVRIPSPRPAPHKASGRSQNIYERDLDRT